MFAAVNPSVSGSIWRGKVRRSRMKMLVFDEISIDREIRGGVFPLKLGGQTRACPICKCIGFEITDVRNGFVFIDGTKTRKREIAPRAVALRPIEWRLPALLVDRCPAKRQPKLRPVITVICNE